MFKLPRQGVFDFILSAYEWLGHVENSKSFYKDPDCWKQSVSFTFAQQCSEAMLKGTISTKYTKTVQDFEDSML